MKKIDTNQNLVEKEILINRLKNLIDDDISVSKKYQELKKIQNSWFKIGPVPRTKSKIIWNNFQHHIKNFYDYLHLNRKFKEIDLEHNRIQKEKILLHAKDLDGQKTSQDWQQFRTNRLKFMEKIGPSYSGRITLSNGVDPFSKGYFQLYEAKVYEPEKLIAAHSKAMKEVWDYKGNAMLFGTYDVGTPGGATHFAAFGADNLESLMLWKVFIEQNNSKGQAEYFKSRGKVEETTNYSLRILKQYGGF